MAHGRARQAGSQCRLTSPTRRSHAGHRFPPEVTGHAIRRHFRFPPGLRTAEEVPAPRAIIVSRETVRRWALEFGRGFANRIRRRLPQAGDERHLDEVRTETADEKHRSWRAVDRDGLALDVPVQGRRDSARHASCRGKQTRPPRATVTDKLASQGE